MPTRRTWLRLGGNLLAAFLVGEGLLVAVAPRRQTLLWSPAWSPALWRRPLRFLARHPGLTRLLALFEVSAGFGLAMWTNTHPEDRSGGGAARTASGPIPGVRATPHT